jgi:hypothetical protein
MSYELNNNLGFRTSAIVDPRMPAILDDAWSTWLGEDGATPAAAKALLKTMEGVNWQATPEPKNPRVRP